MRRLLILATVGLALLAPVSPTPAATVTDRTFHVTLLPDSDPLGGWSVTGSPAARVARTGPEIVLGGASGPVASVAAWSAATRALDLAVVLRNLGTEDAPSGTLVVDMVSPAWDTAGGNGGGFVRGVGDSTSNGYLFGERLATGPLTRTASASVTIPLQVGTPGVPLPPRLDVYFHVETVRGGVVTRHGQPAQPLLPKVRSKLMQPPAGTRYAVLDTIDANGDPNRWADRFTTKYDVKPAVYQFIGGNHTMDTQTLEQYATEISAAARRGMVPGIQLGIGTLGSQGTWTWQQMIDGVHDEKITALAVLVRDLGWPVVGFLGEEFNKSEALTACGADGAQSCSTNAEFTESDANAYGDPAYPDAAERFRDAARHVVDLFDEVGATNVTYAIMANVSTYDAPGFPYDDGSTSTWWDDARYFYPGDDYVDIVASQIYFSFPNPGGVTFPIRPLDLALRRKHVGYDDWMRVGPQKMFGTPDDLRVSGAMPGQNGDRSALITHWYDTMPRFPAWQYVGIYESGADNPVCATAAGYCLSYPAYTTLTGLADYGYYHPQEIDAVRDGAWRARWVETPVLSADSTAPGQVTDLVARPGADPLTVVLTWTAPGDDGARRTAHHYTLHAREGALSATSWSSPGTVALAVGTPQRAGKRESVTVRLPRTGTWTFGIKATDEVPHTSPVSNTAVAAI